MEKHTHNILRMNNGWELRFVDTRRFGRLWYLRADEIPKQLEYFLKKQSDSGRVFGRKRKGLSEYSLSESVWQGGGIVSKMWGSAAKKRDWRT